MLPMSSSRLEDFGLAGDEAASLGADAAVRIRTFRLIIVLAQRLRTLMDAQLRPDGLTTQQAALITIIDALRAPTLSQAARELGTTHQNTRQIASALERKGFLRVTEDEHDARIRRLRTTSRSRDYWRQRSMADQQQVVEWFSGLTEEESKTLFDLLLRLHEEVRRASGLTPPTST
jgi:DNA-binding MarR family transcriptional regulator